MNSEQQRRQYYLDGHGKLKLLFINIFSILFRASQLNIYRLRSDMREMKTLIDAANQEVWIRELLTFLNSSLLLTRFIMCFVGLATQIIALYPLLTNMQGEMFLPTIIVQCIDNVVLNIYELVLGYFCMCLLQPESKSIFVVFVVKLIVKIAWSLASINAYTDMHHMLMPLSGGQLGLERESSEEFEIANQNLG